MVENGVEDVVGQRIVGELAHRCCRPHDVVQVHDPTLRT